MAGPWSYIIEIIKNRILQAEKQNIMTVYDTYEGKMSLLKSHQGKYLTIKLSDRGGFSFKDPLIMRVPNNPNNYSNNIIPMIDFIMWDGRNSPITPKTS